MLSTTLVSTLVISIGLLTQALPISSNTGSVNVASTLERRAGKATYYAVGLGSELTCWVLFTWFLPSLFSSSAFLPIPLLYLISQTVDNKTPIPRWSSPSHNPTSPETLLPSVARPFLSPTWIPIKSLKPRWSTCAQDVQVVVSSCSFQRGCLQVQSLTSSSLSFYSPLSSSLLSTGLDMSPATFKALGGTEEQGVFPMSYTIVG